MRSLLNDSDHHDERCTWGITSRSGRLHLVHGTSCILEQHATSTPHMQVCCCIVSCTCSLCEKHMGPRDAISPRGGHDDGESGNRRMFDKRTLRRMYRAHFDAAIHTFREAKSQHAAQHQLPPSGTAVFLRKRPLFEREAEDFDVITALTKGGGHVHIPLISGHYTLLWCWSALHRNRHCAA